MTACILNGMPNAIPDGCFARPGGHADSIELLPGPYQLHFPAVFRETDYSAPDKRSKSRTSGDVLRLHQ
jgi:hypothetical protein